MVVYQALYDESKIYARPYDMFISKVDRVKYPDADAEYRFTPVNISEEDTAIDSRVMALLDADDFSVKLRILQDMKDNVTNNMLYTMAFSIDFALNDGTTEEKYEELLNGLTLRARFENSRLRS